MPLRPTLAIASFALVSAAAAAPAASASAAACGVGIFSNQGETPWYTYTITKRVGVSCGEAKAAAKGMTDKKICRAKWTSRGWTVRHTDPMFLEAKFTKGRKSFQITSEGAC